MKIFLVCSKHVYDKVLPVKIELEKMGHLVTLPNSFDNPLAEEEYKKKSAEDHKKFKAEMFRLQEEKVKENDALVVLNFDKYGEPNYIGGSTFLEMFKAYELGKKIFLYNAVPNSFLKDEIEGMDPILIDGDLSLVG
ncbi:MAG: hypothetical protein A2589_01480 [Candidatus Vogelbacteria bacterium RIFOXYD1_FULL_46_19]|uniref:Maf-like protein n=1 Tax=Candidatus Vogelbacteria bacterium RIFOXYD1_FULL_46_19 TaxID=1802439 RepID=A0A1G2QG26_9BACT|nr:MAG: hypothetical protein A2589_01480 [Candidatus Vogelbacteria bacterium RIFOXYD1_FULL_46_19]